jgi:signal transduction histidine kinase/ligand-binding sensor domain-containing protein
MHSSYGKVRTRAVAGLAILLACCACAFALDSSLDASQYAHTAWKIREGFSKGNARSIAQTPDGYLWLGTEFGLLRFDGVRAIFWQPPANQHLPSNSIFSLLAARDGTLWIGTAKGLVSWKDGKLTQYAELAGHYVIRLLEDHQGVIWASGLAAPSGRLCAIQNGSVHCHGDDGSLGYGVFGLYEDGKDNLWAGAENGLWRWKPGPPHFYPMPGSVDSIRAFGEDSDGALLISTREGIRRFVDGRAEQYPLLGAVQQFPAESLLRDREGGLWIGTRKRGLVHVHGGRTDVFGQSDGLSGDDVTSLFDDREGNIWVATTNGLDRFRDFAVPTFSVSQGLANADVYSVLASRDGSVWLGTPGGLNRWNNGQISSYDRREGKLNGLAPDSLFQDIRRRIWVSTPGGVGYVENDRFVPVGGVPGGTVHAIAEDTAGNLWIANQDLGLFHLLPGSVVQKIPWAELGRKDHAAILAGDPFGGGVWLGFFNGGVAYFADGVIHASYSALNGLGEGRVNDLRFDQNGTLWAATDGGLSRLKDGHVATLTSRNGLPCDGVNWVMEDDAHSLWLNMQCGLVQVARSELDSWAAAVDKGEYLKRTIQATVFDSSDGVRSSAGVSGYTPHVARSMDGRLWFGGPDGVSVIDPRHLPFNKLPPPVHIEQIVADRKTYWQDLSGDASSSHPRLPAQVRDLTIDYTALSFVAPEKVLFRYKLEGLDHDWQDAGNRRQAFYTNLPPHNYRFRVIACNNSGVWNETGDILDFSIAPAWFQTTWFRVSCVAAFLALLWALYQLRLRQLAQQFNLTLEARVNERTRIARDLHDTLLQSFHGLLFRIQAARNMLPRRPEEAIEALDGVIGKAEQAITEGRDAIRDLRAEPAAEGDLVHLLTALGQELAGSQDANPDSALFRVTVEGARQTLSPILQDEAYRIAREVLRNAFLHARAHQIEAEIRYDERLFRLRIRDDGKGIDPKVLDAGRRAGHWGLTGIRERAKQIGAQLDFWSGAGAGTEVELTVPASVAYETSRNGHGFKLFRKARNHEPRS